MAILDKNMVVGIREELPSLPCSLACNSRTHELYWGIQCHLDKLLEGRGKGASSDNGGSGTGPGVTGANLDAMRLGRSHLLSRYKLKFSSDKVDTMVMQAISLLDKLGKEINTYAMWVKEWYGWHFPGECVGLPPSFGSPLFLPVQSSKSIAFDPGGLLPLALCSFPLLAILTLPILCHPPPPHSPSPPDNPLGA